VDSYDEVAELVIGIDRSRTLVYCACGTSAWIFIQFGLWIRIRIQECKNNSQIEKTVKKFHVLTYEMFDVLFRGRRLVLYGSLKEFHVGLRKKLVHLLIKKLKIAVRS
jgi:hypothetical protein